MNLDYFLLNSGRKRKENNMFIFAQMGVLTNYSITSLKKKPIIVLQLKKTVIVLTHH